LRWSGSPTCLLVSTYINTLMAIHGSDGSGPG
jgi:hypothetical protein